MKFSEKYELLESLTTGAIETFAANDRVRGERVLVHIVECAPQKPEQSLSEWVLESFRRLGPEPAGPVLETGKYSGALYAYLVTRPSDEAAVKSWIRRYEVQSEETKETNIHRLTDEVGAPPPTPIVPAVVTPKSTVTPREEQPAPGQMTQLFRDYDSLAKARSSSAPQNPPARPVNLVGESGLHSAEPWDPASLKPAESPKGRIPESFSNPAKPVAPEFPVSPVKEGPKPGEFTSFFQGPFRGDAPSEVPAFSSEPIEPPRKSVGEFTAMFGQASFQPSESAPGNKASATGFTGLFRDMEKPQPTFNPAAPSAGRIVPPPIEPLPVPSAPKDPSLSPQAPIFVAPPPPVTAIPPVVPVVPQTPAPVAPLPSRPGSLPGEGATGVFNRPSVEPAPVPVQPPSGPSPYTQIISRQRVAAEESGEANTPAAASPAAGGGFAPPPMPKIPAAAPPPIPRMPVPPPIPPAPMPKMTAPKPQAAPKTPKLDAAPPPPVSYWPLIITLTVLFFLAVLLVLYFVMKH